MWIESRKLQTYLAYNKTQRAGVHKALSMHTYCNELSMAVLTQALRPPGTACPLTGPHCLEGRAAASR